MSTPLMFMQTCQGVLNEELDYVVPFGCLLDLLYKHAGEMWMR